MPIPLLDGFGVRFDELEYPLSLFAELPVQFLEFIFVEPELLPAGFHNSDGTLPDWCGNFRTPETTKP